jgi:hypothetical protein
MTEHTTQDFFFGAVTVSEQGASIKLNQVFDAAQFVSREFFTAQLNRLLAASNGRLIINKGEARPDFHDLLMAMNPSDIGRIELYARPNRAEIVRATISCDLILEQGRVIFYTEWSAYKATAAEEVAINVLYPLLEYGLIQRTALRSKNGALNPLVNTEWEQTTAEALKRLFELTGHPYALQVGEEDRERFNKLVRELR